MKCPAYTLRALAANAEMNYLVYSGAVYYGAYASSPFVESGQWHEDTTPYQVKKTGRHVGRLAGEAGPYWSAIKRCADLFDSTSLPVQFQGCKASQLNCSVSELHSTSAWPLMVMDVRYIRVRSKNFRRP